MDPGRLTREIGKGKSGKAVNHEWKFSFCSAIFSDDYRLPDVAGHATQIMNLVDFALIANRRFAWVRTYLSHWLVHLAAKVLLHCYDKFLQIRETISRCSHFSIQRQNLLSRHLIAPILAKCVGQRPLHTQGHLDHSFHSLRVELLANAAWQGDIVPVLSLIHI